MVRFDCLGCVLYARRNARLLRWHPSDSDPGTSAHRVTRGVICAAEQGAAYNTSIMEQENNEHIDLLHGKVNQLKHMSIQIGEYVKEDNIFLDDMSGKFDRTNNLLGGTMKRLDQLAQTKDGRHMIYLGLFVFVVFVMLYVMRR